MEALYAEGEISEKEKNILGKSLQLTQADPALFSSWPSFKYVKVQINTITYCWQEASGINTLTKIM